MAVCPSCWLSRSSPRIGVHRIASSQVALTVAAAPLAAALLLYYTRSTLQHHCCYTPTASRHLHWLAAL